MVLERHKEYYEKNKEEINCECGGKYTYYNKNRHIKTKKHQNYINQLHQNI